MYIYILPPTPALSHPSWWFTSLPWNQPLNKQLQFFSSADLGGTQHKLLGVRNSSRKQDP